MRPDFKSFGSTAQVGRALNGPVAEGALVRPGVGVYAKAKTSVLSGKPIPVKPLKVLTPQALLEPGVELKEARLTNAYNSGRSTRTSSPTRGQFCPVR